MSIGFFSGFYNHKHNGSYANNYSYCHLGGQSFAEQERSYQDCRKRFKHAQDSRLCGTYIAGRNSNGEHRNHRRNDCQADEIPPVSERVDAFKHASALDCAYGSKKDSPCDQRIKSNRMFRNVPDAFAPVYNNQIQRITQGRSYGKQDSRNANLNIPGGGGKKQDTPEGCRDATSPGKIQGRSLTFESQDNRIFAMVLRFCKIYFINL